MEILKTSDHGCAKYNREHVDLNQRFPFLSDEERAIIASFEQGSITQSAVVDLMHKLTDDFRGSSTTSARVKVRAKLLGLAGLYEVIPIAKFEHVKNAPLSLTLLEMQIDDDEEPLRALMRCEEVPFDMIVNFPGLKEFFEIKRPDGKSYQEVLLQKQSEVGGVLVVLKADMNQEVVGYVSASSEPLTRSIILNPWIDGPQREIRDFASMAYDMVMQLEFLDIFYASKDVLNRKAVQAAMRMAGLRFVFDIFSRLLKRAIEEEHLAFEITPSEVVLTNNGGDEGKELCQYLKYILYTLGLSTIEQIIQILGIDEGEREVGLVLVEHSISFDPRRVGMRIE